MNLTIRPAFLPACRRLLWLSFTTTMKVQGEEVTEISTCINKSALPRDGKQATKNAELVLHTMMPNELNSVIAHFDFITTTNQTSHGKSGCCGKVLLFPTKSVHVARFTSPRQTCFAASDVFPVVQGDSRVILSYQKSI